MVGFFIVFMKPTAFLQIKVSHVSLINEFIDECNIKHLFKDTHRKKLFYSIQYENSCLAASDLFHMFTQSIKFYTFYYHVR